MKRAVVSLAVVTGLWAFAFWTITPFCGYLFACGCTLSEGMSECNIWQEQGPHCPWCSYGMIGFYVPFAAILAIVTAGAMGGLALMNWQWWAGLAGGLAAYLAGGLAVGFATAVYRGYPLFLFGGSS